MMIKMNQMRDKYIDLLRDSLSDACFEVTIDSNGNKIYPDPIENGQVWPSKAVTMIGIKRLNNIKDLLTDVIQKGIPGDFLEAGIWRGGALIFARGVLDAFNCKNRSVIGCDSFQGLPPPNIQKYPLDVGDTLHTVKYLAVSQEEVKNNFIKFGLYDEKTVKFVPGFFSESLKGALPFDKLAILRLDSDMYGSTIETLNALYDKVSPGGYIIIDDYALPGCHHATNDFLAQRNIKTPLEVIDWSGRYFKKL
jgi:O-methyltransferase